LHAPPARRCRQADFLTDVSDGPRTILLQDTQDLDVHFIQHGRLSNPKTSFCTKRVSEIDISKFRTVNRRFSIFFRNYWNSPLAGGPTPARPLGLEARHLQRPPSAYRGVNGHPAGSRAAEKTANHSGPNAEPLQPVSYTGRGLVASRTLFRRRPPFKRCFNKLPPIYRNVSP
jgi:hypothetical protein